MIEPARRWPLRTTLAALALAACVLLPVVPGERSALELFIQTLRRDWFSGVLALLFLGGPYTFGLCLAIASRTRGSWSATLTAGWVALLQLELLIVGLWILRLDDPGPMRARMALVGFAIGTAVSFAFSVVRASGDLRFWARWGAVLVAGTFGWLLVQPIEVASPLLRATTAAAALLAIAVPRRSR